MRTHTMQCQSSHWGSKSFSLSSGVLPHIIWRCDPAWHSQVSWSPPDAPDHLLMLLADFFAYPWSRYSCIFFISTSSTTTDVLDICAVYLWVMCCGTAFESGQRSCMSCVRIQLTRITRFSFAALTSDWLGKKHTGGNDDNLATCPVRERPMSGIWLHPTSRTVHVEHYSLIVWTNISDTSLEAHQPSTLSWTHLK